VRITFVPIRTYVSANNIGLNLKAQKYEEALKQVDLNVRV